MRELPTPARIKVTRAELRNRKIILVLEPDLLSDEVFAVNAFYDEGEEKNKLKQIQVSLNLTEKNGKIEVENCAYAGYHSTTGHSQIHHTESMFVDKKDKAVHELLTTPYKYIEGESRMKQLLDCWNEDQEFRKELVDIIVNRKEEHRKDKLSEALEEYEGARVRLEKAMNISVEKEEIEASLKDKTKEKLKKHQW